MSAQEPAPAPWHASYPAPRAKSPGSMTREAVLQLLKASDTTQGKDFVVVDVRRADHEANYYQGGFIRGSLNLPAQSLYPSLPTLYTMFRAAGVKRVIWYCSSSRGRGTRAAGWLRDHIEDNGDQEMQSVILLEGIKGWATAGGEFVDWVDEFDASAWADAK